MTGDAEPRLGQRLRAHRRGQLVELAHGRRGEFGRAEPEADVEVDRGLSGVFGQVLDRRQAAEDGVEVLERIVLRRARPRHQGDR